MAHTPGFTGCPRERGEGGWDVVTGYIWNRLNPVCPKQNDVRHQHNPNPTQQINLRRPQLSQPPNRETGWYYAKSLKQGYLVPSDPKYLLFLLLGEIWCPHL